MKVAISKQDWLLLVIAEASDKGLTPAKLQKSLFLLKKSFPDKLKDFYDFTPYNYGPFDVAIYNDADILVIRRLIKKNKISNFNWAKYQITEKGQEKVVELLPLLDQNIKDYVKSLIAWIQDLSFQELISSIYKKYPEYRVNSVFRE